MNFLTKENQHFFVGYQFSAVREMRGIRSVNLPIDPGLSPIRYIGMSGENPFLPISSLNNQLSINSSLIGLDYFMEFTGNGYFNAYLTEEAGSADLNISALHCYLTSYQLNCAIGQIPEISISASVLGEIRKLSESELGSALAYLLANPKDEVEIISPGSIEVSFDGLEPMNLRSANLKIEIERKALYGLGVREPVSVSIQHPVNVTCEFVISAKDYPVRGTLASFERPLKSDVSFLLKNQSTNSTLVNYSFNDMTLINESYSPSSEGDEEVTLVYKLVF